MATLGPTTERTYGAEWWGSSVSNQYAAPETFPSGGGRITRIGWWASGKDATCSAKGAVWNSTRNSVVAQTGSVSMTGYAFAIGNSTQHEAAVSTTYDAGSSEAVYIGFVKAYTGAAQFSFNNTGSHYDDDNGSSNPSGMSGETLHSSREPAFYLVYDTIAKVYVRRSGAWVQNSATYVRRSGAWSSAGPSVYVRRSGAWVKA